MSMTGNRNHFQSRLMLLSGMFLLVFMGAGAQQAHLVNYLRDVTGWSGAAAGGIIMGVYASMLCWRLLVPFFFARWSDRTLCLLGALGYILFPVVMALTAQAESYPLALGAAVVWGMGGALMWSGTAMQTLALADEAGGRHGTGMGLLYASTHAGWMSGTVLLGFVMERLPVAHLWAMELLAAGLTSLGVLLATFLPPVERTRPTRPMVKDLLDAFFRRRIAVAGALQFASALSFGLLLVGLSPYVRNTFGERWVWIVVALYPGTRMALSFLGGWLADRLGQAVVLLGGFLLGACGVLGAYLWVHPVVMVLAAVSLGLVSAIVPVVASAMVGTETTTSRRPVVYGVVFAWRDLGVVSAALAVNLLDLSVNLRYAFGVFAAVFAACAGLSLLLLRSVRTEPSA